MKILSFSYCFPNQFNPNWGVFIAQRLSAFSTIENIDLEVCSPIPKFPIFSNFKSRIPPKLEENRGLRVYHPTYFYIPKVLKFLDGKFYAQGLYGWVYN